MISAARFLLAGREPELDGRVFVRFRVTAEDDGEVECFADLPAAVIGCYERVPTDGVALEYRLVEH